MIFLALEDSELATVADALSTYAEMLTNSAQKILTGTIKNVADKPDEEAAEAMSEVHAILKVIEQRQQLVLSASQKIAKSKQMQMDVLTPGGGSKHSTH